MPILQVFTNLPRSSIPDDLNVRLTKVLAQTLSKPESYCVVHIVPDQLLTWNGTNEPCAVVNLMSIGRLGVEENKKHSNAVMSELNQLGIPSTRMYISFVDPKPGDVGYNNSTFHGLL
jgi:phenylpyruvate tautomerase